MAIRFEPLNKMTTAIMQGQRRVGSIDHIDGKHIVSLPVLRDAVEGRFDDPKWARKYALDCMGSIEIEESSNGHEGG